MAMNLGAIHEAIAVALAERECLVFRDRRLTWSEVTDRTRRLADVLRSAGLGFHTERSALENWSSGQDHVALYLYNGNEYLEGMLGAYKARAAPFNVNYRYVDDELTYLFDNADARAVIYHASFAPTLARVRDQLRGVRVWLQVDDGSGEPLLPGAVDYEQALAAARPLPPVGLSEDDLYILYTGGTTGMPKGVLWRQADIFRAALYGREVDSLDEIVERARDGRHSGMRLLPAPPFMHGAAHWAAFNMWHYGATIVVQSEPRRFDPSDILATVERERVNALTIVGDAFGRPLVDELRARSYDVSSLSLLTTGGAILSPSVKRELLELLPKIRIRDALGSSESGAQASRMSSRADLAAGDTPGGSDFELEAGNVVLNHDRTALVAPGSGEQGWLAREGTLPLGYYKDAEKTAATFPVVNGVRYAVPGDLATLEADGRLRLLGRESVTINTGGEKVFAEEVETALKQHPAVYDAVVVGTPHERFGQQVTALVRWRESGRVSDDELRAAANAHLASYKLPRVFVAVDEIVRSPSGKADYRWAKATALAQLENAVG